MTGPVSFNAPHNLHTGEIMLRRAFFEFFEYAGYPMPNNDEWTWFYKVKYIFDDEHLKYRNRHLD